YQEIVVVQPADTGTASSCFAFLNGMNYYNDYWTGQHVLDFKTDAQGNTYVSGYQYTQTTYGALYLFIKKYDAQGNLVWENDQDGTSLYVESYHACVATQLTIGNDGSVYFIGNFAAAAVKINNQTIDGYNLIYTTKFKGCVGKLNGTTGICDWLMTTENAE